MKNRLDLWGAAGITIVVLPSGQQADLLYEVAKEWTSLRLLGPSIWVRPESFQQAGGPPLVEATVLASTRAGETKEKKLDLFKLLALQPLSVIRLLVVRPAIPNSEFDLIQDKFVELISPYLDLAIPQVAPSSESDGEGIFLVKINLITGPTQHVIEDATPMLDSFFNAHFVPSAEDRSGPRTGDAFVRYSPDSSKFAGFTLLHLATLGALWVGVPKGGYELAKQAAWEGETVYVSRVFVSAILTDGLIRRACSRVLEAVADSRGGIEELGIGLAIEGTYPIQDSEVDIWLDYMTEKTFQFDGEMLTYKPVLTSPTPPKAKLGFGGQLSDFSHFALGKLGRVPYFAWQWILKKLSNLFNQLFQGGSRGSAEVISPEEVADPLDKVLLQKFDEVFEVKRLADQALVSPVGRSALRSTPVLWESIRKMVFGFMDGSNLMQFGVARSDNGWPVFYRVSSTFPDPAKKFDPEETELSPAGNFGWGDTSKAQEYLQTLKSEEGLSQSDLKEKLDQVVAAEMSIRDLEQKLAQANFHAESTGAQDMASDTEGGRY